MACHAAPFRQDADGGMHAADILRCRLAPHEDAGLPARGAGLRILLEHGKALLQGNLLLLGETVPLEEVDAIVRVELERGLQILHRLRDGRLVEAPGDG